MYCEKDGLRESSLPAERSDCEPLCPSRSLLLPVHAQTLSPQAQPHQHCVAPGREVGKLRGFLPLARVRQRVEGVGQPVHALHGPAGFTTKVGRNTFTSGGPVTVTVTEPIPCYRSREGLFYVCLTSGNQRRSCYRSRPNRMSPTGNEPLLPFPKNHHHGQGPLNRVRRQPLGSVKDTQQAWA